MKCPKCGYLGYDAVDRCRNCGYEFSLAPSGNLLDLSIRNAGAPEAGPLEELPLGARSASGASSGVTEFAPDIGRLLAPALRETSNELTLFDAEDDAPLITEARPPRPPLAVRRATQEVPRVRPTQPRAPMLDLASPDEASSEPHATGLQANGGAAGWAASAPPLGPRPAAVSARVAAAAVDLLILAVVDALVVYFTMQICGVDFADFRLLPKGPLVAFLLVQNGGYLVAFTVGGQTLGKMAAGIKVVSARSNTPLDLGRALLRTIVWALLAVPAGLGFLTALFSADHRGLHDRCAGTKVVRASA